MRHGGIFHCDCVSLETELKQGLSKRENYIKLITKIFLTGFFLLATCCSSVESDEGVNIVVVDRNHLLASDDNPGTEDAPKRTISGAVNIAQAGDTILVYDGVYRERVTPARSGEPERPLVFKAVNPGKAIIRGSDIFTGPWKWLGGQKYRINFADISFNEFNPFLTKILVSRASHISPSDTSELQPSDTLGQIFINGKALQPNDDPQRGLAGTWHFSEDGLGIELMPFPTDIPLESSVVEISTRSRVFAPYRRGLQHIHVTGFVMEHAIVQGPFPQSGLMSIRSGSNWIIDNNVIRHSTAAGLDVGSEYWDIELLQRLVSTHPDDRKLMFARDNVIQNNVISDNGLNGISGWTVTNTSVRNNAIVRNNSRNFPLHDVSSWRWAEWAGIKFLAPKNVLINDNIISDNNAFGVWLDTGYNLTQVSGNILYNNSMSGIMIELGSAEPGVLIDNNIIVGTRFHSDFHNGSAISAHDASDVTIINNVTVGNDGNAVNLRIATNREFAGEINNADRLAVYGNVTIDDKKGISLPIPAKRSRETISDYNYLAHYSDRAVSVCTDERYLRQPCESNSFVAANSGEFFEARFIDDNDKLMLFLPESYTDYKVMIGPEIKNKWPNFVSQSKAGTRRLAESRTVYEVQMRPLDQGQPASKLLGN